MTNKEVAILDTSVILNNPRVIYEFDNTDVVIPITTLNELNDKKNLKNELGKNARTFFRNYMNLRSIDGGSKHLENGVSFTLSKGSKLIIELNHNSMEIVTQLFGNIDNDLKILSVGLNFARERIYEKITLYTNDYELVLRADIAKNLLDFAENFNAVIYNQQGVGEKNYNEIYSGKDEYVVSEEFIQKFREGKNVRISEEELLNQTKAKNIYLNQFVVCKSEHNDKNKIIGRLVIDRGVKYFRKIRTYDKADILGITASKNNLSQQMYLDLLMDESLDFVSAIGSAGTGKTLLSLVSSIKKVQSGSKYKRIILLRPDDLVGKGQGYLPGDLIEKNDPLFKPIYDNLTKLINLHKKKEDKYEVINNIEEAKKHFPFIDIESISYIRGRSIDDAIIIVEEAPNLTVEQAVTIITRAGKNSKVIFTGDIHQIDNPYNDEINNGHVYAMERFKGDEITAGIVMDASDGERSRLTNLAIKKLYKNIDSEN